MGVEFYAIAFFAGALAAVINALAGGGPILTLGFLSIAGMDPRIANLTSTVALSPGQLAAGWSARRSLGKLRIGAPVPILMLSIAGGASGAALLLLTSSSAFTAIVPWLVLTATAIYAWNGVHGRSPAAMMGRHKARLTALFAPLAVYGGYFGGGNSFLVLALLGVAGHEPKEAGEAKNGLIAAINLGAVIVFALSGLVDWKAAVALGAGGLLGSIVGVRLYARMPTGAVRLVVVGFGLLLAAWMFAR